MGVLNDFVGGKSGKFNGIFFSVIRILIYLGIPGIIWINLLGNFNPLKAIAISSLILLAGYIRYRITNGEDPKFREVMVFFPAAVTAAIFVTHIWDTYYIGTLRLFADAVHGYIPMAEMNISTKFFLGGKPFVTPLIFKIFGNYMKNVNIFFVTGYIAISFLFTFSLTTFFKKQYVRMLLYYMLLMFFLNQSLMTVWLTIAQSEAPSIIFTLLLFSFCFWCFRYREDINNTSTGIVAMLVFIVILILFTFTRDTNSYFIPFLIPFFYFVFRKKWMFTIVTSLLLSVFFIHLKSFELSGRWKFPLTNVLCKRIIPNRQFRTLFQQKYHLPPDSVVKFAVKKHAGKHFKNKEKIYKKGRDDNWVNRYGLNAYRNFLISHPGYFVSTWIDDWNYYNSNFFWLGDKLVARRKLNNFLFDFPGNISVITGFLLFILSLIVLKKYPPLLLLFLHAFIIGVFSLHGDAMSVPRHMQQAAMTLRIASIFGFAILFSWIGKLEDRSGLGS